MVSAIQSPLPYFIKPHTTFLKILDRTSLDPVPDRPLAFSLVSVEGVNGCLLPADPIDTLSGADAAILCMSRGWATEFYFLLAGTFSSSAQARKTYSPVPFIGFM